MQTNSRLIRSGTILLSVLTGIVFLLSAISKLPSLEQFGWMIVETSFLGWVSAEWLARLFVGLELFLGCMMIFQFYVRKIAVPIAIFIILLFSAYLMMVIALYGNTGNCGCFGEWIPMTPVQSLLKNLVLLFCLLGLRFHTLEFNFRGKKWVLLLMLMGAVVLPFIWLPPESIYLVEKEPVLNKPIQLSILYQSAQNRPPVTELRQGKHIIAFMSLTCSFCKKAAKRMHIMKKKHPELPIFMVLNGDTSKLKEFFDATQASHIDHMMFNGAQEFTMLNDGYTLPTIKWVVDTTVVRESNYLNLQEDEILAWLEEDTR
jgi:hypothetical protein